MVSKSLVKFSLIPVATLVLMSTDASAGTRQRNFLFETGNGITGQVSGTVNGSAGHASGDFTGSTSNGGGWTRSFDRSYDPATRGWSQTGQVTANAGKTYNYSGSGNCASGTGCSSSGDIIGPNGRTVTHNGTAQATGNGGWKTDGSWTGPNGHTVDTQHWIQITPAN